MRKLLFVSTTLVIAAMLCPPPALVAQEVYRGGAVDARQHGFEHGYREGFSFGQNSQISNRDQDIVNQKLRDADRDYQSGFGSQDQYREGYTEGFRAGMEDSRGGKRSRLEEMFRSRDPNYNPNRLRDDRIEGIPPQSGWSPAHLANDIGYRDGVNAGLRDRKDGRSSGPRQQAAWRTGLHGYDKNSPKGQYKAAYRSAFELGYADGLGGRR